MGEPRLWSRRAGERQDRKDAKSVLESESLHVCAAASESVLAVLRMRGLVCPCSAGRPRISTPLYTISYVHHVARTYCSTSVQRVIGTPVYMVLSMQEADGAREIPETQKVEAHQVFLDFCSGT